MSWWLRCSSVPVRSKVQFSSPTPVHLILWVGRAYLRVGWVHGMHEISFLKISLSKNSHVAYSHHPYKMSHLHNFPCPIEYSHYQSRGMCKIPTLSTFPSKPYEPRDMKGNFGKFSHWDTSESSMWVIFRIHPQLIFEGTWKMSTCNRMDLNHLDID